MTPREPEEVDRKLRRWLWNEEQRWKGARRADAESGAVGLSKRERRAVLALAAMANADAASITMTRQAARRAREMLCLEWPDVEKLSGIIAGVIIGFEVSGRSSAIERKRLQQFYEREGLTFGQDGSVAWAE